MKPSEQASRSRFVSRGSLPARLLVLTLAGMGAVPGAAFADTILTFNLNSSSDLAGSTSGTPTAFCTVGSTCPGGSPGFPLTANVPLTGTISVDTTNSTMTFDLTLAQNASFGGGLTLDKGSSFISTTSSPVSVLISSSTKKGVTTDTILAGSTSTALGTLLLSSGFTQTENQGIVSGLSCSITVGSGGNCGFLIGTPVSGTDALQVSNGTAYDGVMSINALLTPVPLPPSLWLMAGASGLIFMRRRPLA